MTEPSPAVVETIKEYMWEFNFVPPMGFNYMEARARELYRRIIETAEREQFAREDQAA